MTKDEEIALLTMAVCIYADRANWHPAHPSFYIGPRYSHPWEVALRALVGKSPVSPFGETTQQGGSHHDQTS
jgi:hypothetical protein